MTFRKSVPVLTLAAGIAIGSYWQPSLGPNAVAGAGPIPHPEALQKNAENFRAVAHQVGPSVVTIRTKSNGGSPARQPQARGRYRQSPQGSVPPDSMEDLLRGFGFQFGPGGMGGMQGFRGVPQGPRQGSGSGFVIDRRGYIVTNFHVVKEADEIEVLLPDEESEPIKATIVGTDPRTDLAVVKIDAGRDLSPLDWAEPSSVEVGDAAIAIGSPFELTHSVTAGIVSAKGRNAAALMGADFGYELIQTDAAINPGNSGGPLCTGDGKVMGVNTAIFSQTGGNMGIGFAIPSSVAKGVTAALIADGKITRGWLGVGIQNADKDLRKDLGVDKAVVVHEVQPGSPAEKAGLKAGDAIVKIGGEKVTRVDQLQRYVADIKPGQTVAIDVIGYQDRRNRHIEVTIGKLPEPDKTDVSS